MADKQIPEIVFTEHKVCDCGTYADMVARASDIVKTLTKESLGCAINDITVVHIATTMILNRINTSHQVGDADAMFVANEVVRSADAWMAKNTDAMLQTVANMNFTNETEN